MKKTIFMVVLMVFMFSSACFAHGVTYVVKNIGENTIRITLKGNLPKGYGYEITSASKREGKLLNIFFKTEKGVSGMDSLDVDLKTMLPPVRIILTNVDNEGQGSFKDIKGIYGEQFIRHLHDMGSIGGYPDGTFKPDRGVTRAEFVTMLLNALKVESKSKSKGFKDTNKHWAKTAINTACDMKIVGGFKDGTFKPNKNVTVAEASAIIARIFAFKSSIKSGYPKMNTKHWAYQSLKKMFSSGVILNTDPLFKKFKEDSFLNRADCAIIISRAITTN